MRRTSNPRAPESKPGNDPRDFTLRWRLLLVAVTGSVPLFVVALALLSASFESHQAVLIQEERGVAFQEPLESLIHTVPRARAAALAAARGDTKEAGILSSLRRSMERDIQSLTANSLSRLGQALAVTGEPLDPGLRQDAGLSEILEAWRRFEETGLSGRPDPTATTLLLDCLGRKVTRIRDSSRLILDDQFESYYLADLVSAALPQTELSLADLLLGIRSWREEGSLAQHRSDLAVLAERIGGEDRGRIARDADIVTSENARSGAASSRVEAALRPAKEEVQSALSKVRDLISRQKEGRPIDTAALDEAGWRASDAVYGLWQSSSEALHLVLTAREEAIASERRRAYAVVVATLGLVAAAMGVLITRLVRSHNLQSRRNREDLEARDAQVRALGEYLPDSVIYQVIREHDGTMRFLYVSGSVKRLNGLEPEALLADYQALGEQMIGEGKEVVARARERSAASLTLFDVVIPLRRADGVLRQMRFAAAPRTTPDGRILWDGIESDVTQQVQAQEQLRRLNRALRAISTCNLALMRASDEATLLSEVCNAIVEKGGHTLAWVGYAGPEPSRAIVPIAASGNAIERIRTLQLYWDGDKTSLGPTGTAIRTGKPSVASDIQSDPRLEHWRQSARASGTRSCVALPLVIEGSVLGAITIYSMDVEAFDPEEVSLLEQLAGDLSYGLQALRLRASLERTRDELRDSEARFRSTMTHSAIGMAIISPERVILEVNPAYCELLGREREELVGHSFKEFTYPEDQGVADNDLNRALQGIIDSYAYEKRYVRKGGQVVWTEVTVSLVRDGAGKPLHFIGQVQDITQRRRALALLAESEERLRLSLQASKLGLWRTNLQTGQTEWDSRLRAIYGLGPEAELPTGERFVEGILPEDRESFNKAWNAILRGSGPQDLHFRYRRPDGSVVHIESHTAVQNDAGGRPLWVVGVDADVTEIVRATAQTERWRERLAQAQKMETLGTLAAGIAHDFNNLLTGINGFIDLAGHSLPASHEAHELLGQAKRGSLNARDLVRRILTFARREEDSKRVPVNLASLVGESTSFIAASFPPTLALEVSLPTEPATILCDPVQIQQVLMNLCTNAAQAVGARKGTVSLAVATTANQQVSLSVSDTGCGMPESVIQRIFEPFYTTKRPGEGTGLGLSMVRDIVSTHEGTIAVRSTPGEGSTFVLTFPAWRGEQKPAAPQPGPKAGKPGRGQRILIVDDDPSVANVARVALSRAGFNPECAGSAAEALRRMGAGDVPYDLALVDLWMPDASGTELGGQLRGLRPGLPLIVMSGRFERTSLSGDDRLPLCAHLKKPFEIDELIATVNAQLARSGEA